MTARLPTVEMSLVGAPTGAEVTAGGGLSGIDGAGPHSTARYAPDAPGTPPSWRGRARRHGRHQGVVLGAQLLAGLGNLVFSLALARELTPADFAALVAFLGVYLLAHTLAAALAPAVAVNPRLDDRLRGRLLVAGAEVGVAVTAGASWVSSATGLSGPAVLALAAAAPSAAVLPMVRGRLFGEERPLALSATLLSEPAVRLLVGLVLAATVGLTGAVIGVVAAGYVALGVGWVATAASRRASAETVVTPGSASGSTSAVGLAVAASPWTGAAFFLVAVIGAQDVVIAHRLLSAPEAAVFAAVSVLGGIVFFATSTIPLVLLPQAARRDPGALFTAIVLVAALSSVAVAGLALAPRAAYAFVLGDQYAAARDLALPYLLAMAALGLARVLLAHLCATGGARIAVALTGAAVVVQVGKVATAGDAAAVVYGTALASGCLLLGTAGAFALRAADRSDAAVMQAAGVAPVPDRVRSPRPRLARPSRATVWTSAALVMITGIGLALRSYVTRSVWIDEAISISQASQTYPEMILLLRNEDVHPPLYHSMLWVVIHVTGSTSELVVRFPSMVLGTALIPLFFFVGRDLWDRRTGLIAALVVAVAPIAVWYSQEARMYALWMLWATLLLWMTARLLRGNGRTSDWVALTLAGVASFYTQWFAALPLAVVYTLLLAYAVRTRRTIGTAALWRWWASVIVAVGLVAPLLPYWFSQASRMIGGSGSTPTGSGQTGSEASAAAGDVPDVYAALANVIWAVWGYHSDPAMVALSALWPVLALLAFALLGRGRSTTGTMLVAVAAVPFALLFLLGFQQRNFFELRFLTAMVPALLLLGARLVSSWGRTRLSQIALPTLLVLSLAAGLSDQQVNRSNPRVYDFRGAVSWVADRGTPDDRLVFAPEWLEDELTYYSPGMPTVAVGEPLPQPADGSSVFVLGSFLSDASVSSSVGTVLALLEQGGARLVDRHRVANVEVWEYQ